MKRYSNIIAIGFFLSGIILSCGDTTEKKVSEASVNQPPNGKNIFRVNCVQCHGAYGDLGINGAKNLLESTLTLEERIEIIANGKNVMTPFKSLLSEDKIRAVAEYTMELQNQ